MRLPLLLSLALLLSVPPTARAAQASVAFVLEGRAEVAAAELQRVRAEVIESFGKLDLAVGDATPVLAALLGGPTAVGGAPVLAAPLRERLATGRAECAAEPRKQAACNRQLTHALWSAWIETAHPTHVLVLRLSEAGRGHAGEWFTWKPGAAQALRTGFGTGPTRLLAKRAREALDQLIRGEGTSVALVGGVWPPGSVPAAEAKAREVRAAPPPPVEIAPAGARNPDADDVAIPTYLEPDSSDVTWVK